MSEFVSLESLIPEGYDPDSSELHDPLLADEFEAVVADVMPEDVAAEPQDNRRKLFGAELMSGLLEEPTTTRNFSMTRSGGAWGENE